MKLILPHILVSAILLTLPLAAMAQDNNAAPVTDAAPAADVTATTPPPVADVVPVVVPPPASTPPGQGQKAISPIEQGIKDQLDIVKPTVSVNGMRSLFYNTWEHDLIIDARRGITTGTAVVNETDPEKLIGGGLRDISLAGIVYVSRKDWTIWLNGVQVTPEAIPEAVLDIKVFKDYIDLEWFDQSTNQIFPIRIRPHQRFNLDTRIFLPGGAV